MKTWRRPHGPEVLGLLSLLALEAQDFFWASEGLRLVGRAQFDLKAYREAKLCWEELYKLNHLEPEANQRLGTIYQRLGDLDASDQALHRVLSNKKVTRPERAEALSLIARNIKERWRSSWQGLPLEQAPAAALKSPDLLKAYEKYRQGFQENLDSFYAGLNALSLLTLSRGTGQKAAGGVGEPLRHRRTGHGGTGQSGVGTAKAGGSGGDLAGRGPGRALAERS